MRTIGFIVMRLAGRRTVVVVLSVSLFILANFGNLQAQGVTDPQIPPIIKARICKQDPVNPLCDQEVAVTIVERDKEQRIKGSRFVIFQRLSRTIDQSEMSKEDKQMAEQKLADILSLIEPLNGGGTAAKKPEHTIKTSCGGGTSGGKPQVNCSLAYEIKF